MVYTVDIVYNIDTVDTVDSVHTVLQAALHCQREFGKNLEVGLKYLKQSTGKMRKKLREHIVKLENNLEDELDQFYQLQFR